jgi:hypothetical protein
MLAGKVNVVDKALEQDTQNEDPQQQQVQPELEQHKTSPGNFKNLILLLNLSFA